MRPPAGAVGIVLGIVLCIGLLAAAPVSATPLALPLRTAVSLAVGNDPGVARAGYAVERARLRELRANLQRLQASVDFNAQAVYVSPNVFALPSPAPYGVILPLSTLQGSLQAPLFSGFRVESDIAAAEADEKATEADVDAERLQVSLAVARAWWGARRLALVEDTYVAAFARLDESDRLVKARVDAGLAAGIDETRSRSRRVQLEVERDNLHTQRQENEVQLALLLGVTEPVVLTDDAAVAAVVDADDVDTLLQEALQKRPELRAVAARVQALAARETSAASGFYPQLDAFALVQVGNNPSVAGADARKVSDSLIDGNVQAGLVLRWNLFDTWATSSGVDDLRHQQRMLSADERDAMRGVETAVRGAFVRVQSLRAQREGLVRSRDVVNETAQTLERAFGRGEVLFAEVLDAQGDVAVAERQIVDLDAQLALARHELRAAVGETE